MRFKLLIAALALMPALVSAQNAPNMIGTWTGIFHAAIMGSGSHHLVPNKKDKDIHFNKIPFTLDIDRQDGVNFSGSLATKNRKEIIIGVIAPDFQGGVMALFAMEAMNLKGLRHPHPHSLPHRIIKKY